MNFAKIPLQFKEKHLCYCLNHMMSVVSDSFFHIQADLREILSSNEYEPDDLITINIDPDTLFALHTQLGERPENLTSGIHQRLKEALIPQLLNYIQSIDPTDPDIPPMDLAIYQSVGYILQKLQARESAIDAWVESQISAGRQRVAKT
jgi:hypothetical protein